MWREATLLVNSLFKTRISGSYFLCLGHAQGSQPPVFFYFGNEDHVELYIEHTGIMWETAPAMGAALVFLEHRYYGQSLPFPPGTPGCHPHCPFF